MAGSGKQDVRVESSSVSSEDGSNRAASVIIKKPKLIGSWRLTIAILLLLANFLIIWMRLNMSMAVVCMTGTEDGTLEGEFDWSRSVIANLLGAFFYGYACTQLIGGIMVNRFGAKWLLFGGMLLASISMLFMPLLARWHWQALFAARIFQGAVSGFTLPMVYSLMLTWAPQGEKANLFAIAFSGVPIGSIVNFPFSAYLCYTKPGWPLVFYVPSAVCLVWCILFGFLASNTPYDHPRISQEEKDYFINEGCLKPSDHKRKFVKIPVLSALRSIPIHALWITHFGGHWSYYVVSLNIPLYVDEVYNLGIILNGLISAIPYVVFYLATFAGKIYDFINGKQYISTNALRKSFNTIGFYGTAVFFCTLSLFPSGVGHIAALSIGGIFLEIAYNGGFFISHSDLVGSYASFLFGFTNTMANLTGFLNPLVMSAFLSEEGTEEEWQNVFYVAAGLLAFTGTIYLLFGSNERQFWAGGEKKPKTVLCFYT